MASLANKFRQWQKLSPWERRVLRRLALLLPVAGLLLHWSAWNTIRDLLARLGKPSFALQVPSGWEAEPYAQRCAELTAIAARHSLYRAQCLPQSLVLQCVLAQSGLPAHLRIGVLPGSQPLQAHAWLEYQGIPLGSQNTAAYRPLEGLAGLALLLPN